MIIKFSVADNIEYKLIDGLEIIGLDLVEHKILFNKKYSSDSDITKDIVGLSEDMTIPMDIGKEFFVSKVGLEDRDFNSSVRLVAVVVLMVRMENYPYPRGHH